MSWVFFRARKAVRKWESRESRLKPGWFLEEREDETKAVASSAHSKAFGLLQMSGFTWENETAVRSGCLEGVSAASYNILGRFTAVIRFFTPQPGYGPASSRREWLRLGSLASVSALTVASRANARLGVTSPGFGRAKSVLLVYANGGQSQLETWDPKPDAPREVRGEFGAIASAVPGVFLGEHLPRLARLTNRVTIVRSLSHDDLDHGSATYLALTGRYHPQKSGNPPPRPTDYPTYGALVRRVRPSTTLPYSAVHVNGPALVPELPGPGQDGGFLGLNYDPLVVGDVTGAAPLPDLTPPPDLSAARIGARRSLLRALDGYRRELEGDRRLREADETYTQAYALLDSPRCQRAFDLDAEPAHVRDRYGRHRSGQACLLARRLAEAEVPLITVFWNHSARGQDKHPDDLETYGWDTHNDIFSVYRDHLLPRFDQSVSALLEDLDERGLLDQTLVVCMGEFGRAPRVANEAKFAGALPGRKHWANVYSLFVAGAGVSRGAVLGASDRLAAYPVSERFGPWDVAATMLAALGIDPASEATDPLGRPFPLTLGRPMAGLYAG